MKDLINNHGDRVDDGDGNADDSRRVRGRLLGLGCRSALSVNLGLPTVRGLYVDFRFVAFWTFTFFFLKTNFS